VAKSIMEPNQKTENEGSQHRPTVLVGHDVEQDIAHLQKIGYNVYKNPCIIDVADTKHIHQHLRGRNDAASLARLLDDMLITYKYLHNAGNDAVYTLQGLIALAFKKHELKAAAPPRVKS